MQTYKTAVFPSRTFDLLLRLSDRSLKKHEPLFMCNRVTVCFFFVLVFGLNSIKLSITDQLSLTMTREDHALLSLSLSLSFFNYIPAIFHMCSNTHRYRSLTVDLKKTNTNCHRCITSRIQFTRAPSSKRFAMSHKAIEEKKPRHPSIHPSI